MEQRERKHTVWVGAGALVLFLAAVAWWGVAYDFNLPGSAQIPGIAYHAPPALAAKAETSNTRSSLQQELSRISHTNVLARDFIDLYLQARQENPEERISTNEQTAIASGLTAALREKYTRLANPYIPADMRVSEVKTAERMAEYITAYGDIFGNTFPQEDRARGGPSELVLFFEIVGTEEYARFAELDPYIERYDHTTKRLLALRVPDELTAFHLQSVNTFANVALALSYMKNYTSDPVGALFGADQFNREVATYIRALTELRETLRPLHIPLEQDGDGDLFIRYLETL